MVFLLFYEIIKFFFLLKGLKNYKLIIIYLLFIYKKIYLF